MKPLKYKPGDKGFSLTEVSVAAGIVSFSLLPLVGLLGMVTTYQKTALDEATALSLAESISQTLERESRHINCFIWHLPGNKSVTFNYPGDSQKTMEYYLVTDVRGRVTRSVSSGEFENGLPEPKLEEVALVKILMEEYQGGVSGKLGADPGVSLELFVETPPSVGRTDRDRDSFRTTFR
ncbi:MAG: hypothetical protein P1V20_29180 [Verrucomicrobiales bacterium]|nr:hypothetical protein [Verrucomicrobiales bacterium]